MKKIFFIAAFIVSVCSFSQKTDSLSWYKEKVKAYEQRLERESASAIVKQEIQYDFEKREAMLKAELEGKEAFYKMRIDKLQTLLIAACLSSVLVIVFAIYMLNKKKANSTKK
jgi:hypothetical protein